MRKTFKLFAFALTASLVALTSCKPDDDENNTNNPTEEQPELSYTFEDVASWTPQSIFAGQELAWEGDTLASFIALRDYYPGLDEYYASTNYGEEIPDEHALLFSIPYQVGNHTRNNNFVTDEYADNVVAIFTLPGIVNYRGISLPNAWISENINISVTDIDMVAKKISATITANMMEYVYVFSEGESGNQDSKTLTITIKNYPLDNWTEMDMKKNTKLKHAKRA